MELAGKRVLITGASRGIGQALAERFTAAGSRVALVARSEGPLKELVVKLAHAFHDWVDMIHRSRAALAEDAAHSSQSAAKAKEHA